MSGPLDPGESAVDASILSRLVADVGDVDEMIALYLRALPLRHGSLAQALADRDRAVIVMVAHTLGSASAFVGARRLADICRGLEGTARAGVDPPLEAALEVARECRRVERELRQRFRLVRSDEPIG